MGDNIFDRYPSEPVQEPAIDTGEKGLLSDVDPALIGVCRYTKLRGEYICLIHHKKSRHQGVNLGSELPCLGLDPGES